MFEEFLYRRSDVAYDLPKKERGDVASAVEWHGRASTVGMAELLMRPSLPHLLEAHAVQDLDDLARTEDRESAHGLPRNSLCADKLRFELRLAILKEHRHHLVEVGVQLV